jgi:hypothetical protein
MQRNRDRDYNHVQMFISGFLNPNADLPQARQQPATIRLRGNSGEVTSFGLH